MTWPPYPGDAALPPSARTSLFLGLYAWLWRLSEANPGMSRSELGALAADRIIAVWFSVPWPSERIGMVALLLALLWLAGGGAVLRALA